MNSAAKILLAALMGSGSVKPYAWLMFDPLNRYTSNDALNFGLPQGHNGGALFHPICGNGPSPNRICALSPSDPGNLNAAPCYIKYSDDFGITWTTAHTFVGGFTGTGSDGGIFFHGGWLYAFTGNVGAARSNDSGATWTAITFPASGLNPNRLGPGFGTTLYAFASGGNNIWVSTDQGATWGAPVTLGMRTPARSAKLPGGQVTIFARDSAATGADVGFSTDGTTWTYVQNFGAFNGFTMLFCDYVAKFGQVLSMRSSYAGNTSAEVVAITAAGVASKLAYSPLPQVANDTPTGFAFNADFCALVNSTHVYRLNSLAPTWSRAGVPGISGGNNRSLLFHPGIVV